MSAIKELHAGETGSEFYALLRRTVLAVGIARNFPAPSGGDSWTAKDVDVVANEFLAHSQTPRRLADLALHCASDDALARRLQGSVRNFLRDWGRQTDLGRLIRRVKRALKEESGFFKVEGDRWTLADGTPEPSTAPLDTLQAAASLEPEVVVPSWGAEARRKGPVADKETINRLIRRVLEAAEGSVTAADIAKAIAHRLAIPPQALTLEIDAGDRPEAVERDTPFDATADEVITNLTAKEVLETLTDRERIALGYLELGVRELGPKIGISHSQAAVVRQMAAEKLRAELAGEGSGEAIARKVVQLARNWVDARTAGNGVT